MSDIPFGFGFGSGNDGPSNNGPNSGGAGQNPFDMNSIGAALQQLGAFLQNAGTSGETGPVNWQMVRDIARQQLANPDSGGDPAVADAQLRLHEDTLKVLAVGRQSMAMQLNEKLKAITPMPD